MQDSHSLSKINQAQLDNALMAIDGQSRKRLPNEEYAALGVLMEKTAKRYPNQDLKDALPEYQEDLEQLALKFSLRCVANAVMALRVTPGRKFFPTPDEVAEECEEQRRLEVGIAEKMRQKEAQEAADRYFWLWVEDEMKAKDWTEQQVLDSIKTPGYAGRKARAA